MREPEEHERSAATQTAEAEGLACLIRQGKVFDFERGLRDPNALIRTRDRGSTGEAAAKQDACNSAQPGCHGVEMIWSAVTAR